MSIGIKKFVLLQAKHVKLLVFEHYVFLKNSAKNAVLEVMGVAKYIFALWAGVLIYTSLSITFGSNGLSAQRQLEREQARQEANLVSLTRLNHELENTVNALLYDTETLIVLAREQGYAASSERFVRIVGLGAVQRTRTYPGNVVVIARPQYTSEQTIRLTALFTALAIFACMAIFDILRFLKYKSG